MSYLVVFFSLFLFALVCECWFIYSLLSMASFSYNSRWRQINSGKTYCLLHAKVFIQLPWMNLLLKPPTLCNSHYLTSWNIRSFNFLKFRLLFAWNAMWVQFHRISVSNYYNKNLESNHLVSKQKLAFHHQWIKWKFSKVVISLSSRLLVTSDGIKNSC